MLLETFKVGPIECNCSIVACEETKEALIVDPGGDPEKILERISALGVKVKYILITHAHFDHVLAARAIREATGAQICLHKKDLRLYLIMPLQYRMYGIKNGERPPFPNKRLKHDDRLAFGSLEGRIIHTPGHTPGSCCFHISRQNLLFSGDTLFRESVGITDVPAGSFEALIESLQKLMRLPDETRVIPGHMDETTIAHEKLHNPYLQEVKIEEIRAEHRSRSWRSTLLMRAFNLLLGA
jgi:glyoxylase-like metal-dependent hydrolase (beta-lactamase superfamily II)